MNGREFTVTVRLHLCVVAIRFGCILGGATGGDSVATPDRAAPSSADGPLSAECVRGQLDRILRSATFLNAVSLKRLLSHLVDRTLTGSADEIKEYSLGLEVFDRGEGFDPRTDTIVRVQARRLRAKLQEYYASEGQWDPIVFELPKGRYIPYFKSAISSTPRDVSLDGSDSEAVGRTAVALQPPASGPLPTWLVWRSNLFWAAVAVVVAGSVTLLYVAANKPRTVAKTAIASVAVLPFADLSPSKDKDYLAYGLAEEITSRLTRVSSIRVVGRMSAFALGNQSNPSAKATGANIKSLVTGSIRVQGEQVRVTAQLVNTADERSIWSRTYEGRADDLFRIQDEIAIAICRALETGISPPVGAQRTTNLSAYNRYLQGLYVARTVTPQSLADAMRIHEEVIRLDPDFAPAYASLAHLHGLHAGFHGVQRDQLQTARRLASRAIELDPGISDAYCAIAHVAMLELKWTEAHDALQTALKLSSNNALAHELQALYLMTRGRKAESLEEIEKACELNPLSLLAHWNRGNMLFHARQYDAALKALDEARELDPNVSWIYSTAARVHLQKGNCSEALSTSEKAVVLLGRLHFSRTLTILRCGSVEEKRAAVAEFKRLRNKQRPSVHLAMVHAFVGEREQALDELERAASDRTDFAGYIKVAPEFDGIRSEPRFKTVLSKMGLEE